MITNMNKPAAARNRQASRMTHQRRVILEHVRSSSTHPTADEVYRAVRRRCRHVSLGTVDRNLEVLSKQGLIQKIEFGEGPRRFDGGPPGHYHVKCLRCGQVSDVHAALPDDFQEECAQASDYRILAHRLEFVGLCPACKAKRPHTPGR